MENERQEGKDQKAWWKSLKPGDKVLKCLFPGSPGYEEALKEFEAQEKEKEANKKERSPAP